MSEPRSRLSQLVGQLGQNPQDQEAVDEIISTLMNQLDSLGLPPTLIGLLDYCGEYGRAERMLRQLHRHGIEGHELAKQGLKLNLMGDRRLLLDAIAEIGGVSSSHSDPELQQALLRLRAEREESHAEEVWISLYREGSGADWNYDLARIIRRRRPALARLSAVIEAGLSDVPSKRRRTDSTEQESSGMVSPAEVSVVRPVAAAKSVFLSNLDFACTEESVRSLFPDLPINQLTILRNRSGKSRGLAEVEFATEEARQTALDRDRTRLEGRLVFISPYSQPHSSSALSLQKSYDPRTLFCSHLPDDCAREDLATLFAPLTPRIRLINEYQTGRFRGIAYVEFGSEEEAAQALQQAPREIRGQAIRLQISDQLKAKPLAEHPALSLRPRTILRPPQ